MNFLRTFHIHCPVWVKLDVRGLHEMLLVFVSFVKVGVLPLGSKLNKQLSIYVVDEQMLVCYMN
jgi:hypothetical protein